MKLFNYWRSSASYRVRIALALKGVDYDYCPVNLLKGEQKNGDYLAKNPLALVPALQLDDGAVIVQSLAIINYLDEAFPDKPLLPISPIAKAHARAIATSLACEAQPFMNLRVQNYLKNDLGQSPEAVSQWLNQWPGSAMAAVEKMIEQYGGDYCVGDEPSIADICLVPQVFGALRFGIDLSAMPRIQEIYERACAHPAFEKAHPDNQPDAPEGNA